MQRPIRKRKRAPKLGQWNQDQLNQRAHPIPPAGSLHPAPRNEQERLQLERAAQREQALLWTDDQPFSVWKS